MKLGKSILLAILLLCYGSSGYTATRTIDMASIVNCISQYEAVIKKISFSYWYGLSVKERYVDPFVEEMKAKERRIEAQTERQQSSKENTSTSTPINMGVLGLVLLIIISLAIYALRFEDKKFRQMNGLPSREESCNKYQNVQQAQFAAEQGDAAAQTALGQMYYDGLITPQDFKQAYVWFSVATVMGSVAAKKFRDQTVEKLTPAGLEAAQTQATKFFEMYGTKQIQTESEQSLDDTSDVEKKFNEATYVVEKSSEVVVPVQELNSTTEKKSFYRKLLQGDYSLAMTFWVYFFLFNSAISLVQLFLVTQGSAFFLFGSCIAIWWMFSTVLGTIRAALKYNGLRVWSILAIVAVITNAISLLVYTYFIADFLSNMSYQ